MSSIEFEDAQTQVNQASYQIQTDKGLVGWLINKKIAKDARTANIILLISAAVFFGLTFLLLKSKDVATLTPEQIAAGRKYVEDLINSATHN